MNIQQAKQIKLITLMERLGYEISRVERGGTEYKYKSVFRNEIEPSLNINIRKNEWFDFGEGVGGNPLDFALYYINKTETSASIPKALAWLDNIMGRTCFYSEPRDSTIDNSLGKYKSVVPKLHFLRAIQIKNPLITEYLLRRGISVSLSSRYLLEIHYRNIDKGKNYFGFGMPNCSNNGYEVRSASDDIVFKTAFNRDVSIIEGTHPKYGVNVFEGMLDALSMMEALKVNRLRNDTIIMHSLSSFSRTCDRIRDNEYSVINLFLDNNDSGRKYTDNFRSFFGDRVRDKSELYDQYEDVNDAWRSRSIRIK